MAVRVSTNKSGPNMTDIDYATVDQNANSYPSPILNHCGIPLRIQKTGQRCGTDNSNKFGTFLFADQNTGFAPLEWQRDVGEILIYREDGLPITSEDAWDYWTFLSCLMDYDMTIVDGKCYDTWRDIRRSKWFSSEGYTQFTMTLRRLEQENGDDDE